MSHTYKCDRCGHELRLSQIVGKEFAYMKKFESLSPAYRFEQDGRTVVDVCADCFKLCQDAQWEAEGKTREATRQGFLRRILGTRKA